MHEYIKSFKYLYKEIVEVINSFRDILKAFSASYKSRKYKLMTDEILFAQDFLKVHLLPPPMENCLAFKVSSL